MEHVLCTMHLRSCSSRMYMLRDPHACRLSELLQKDEDSERTEESVSLDEEALQILVAVVERYREEGDMLSASVLASAAIEAYASLANSSHCSPATQESVEMLGETAESMFDGLAPAEQNMVRCSECGTVCGGCKHQVHQVTRYFRHEPSVHDVCVRDTIKDPKGDVQLSGPKQDSCLWKQSTPTQAITAAAIPSTRRCSILFNVA